MNDFIYIYDGSFLNLLNVIEKLIKQKIKPYKIVSKEKYQEELFTQSFNITNSLEKEVIIKIINKLNKTFLKIIYNVFLSNDEQKEMIIYYTLLNGYKYGIKVLNYRKLNCIDKALKISLSVSRETHKMKGFLRFKQLDTNYYIAFMNPTNDIIIYLANYFKKRMPKEYFLIYDVKRNKLCIYNKKKITIILIKDIDKLKLNLNKEEEKIEQMWKTFFNTIAIKERKNSRCQMNFMPKKYWQYIIEMSENYEKNNC